MSTPNKAPRHLESALQRECVTWARYQYPVLKKLLFAIPNGGKRGKVEAGIMKGEGVVSGVADLFLSIPNSFGIHGMYIEMKAKKGRQSDSQKDFEVATLNEGYVYFTVNNFDDFRVIVTNYMESTRHKKFTK